MATLIGDGGHAWDIWPTLPMWWNQVPHHKDFVDDRESYIVGINDPHVRACVATEIGRPDVNWVHPNAYVGPDCLLQIGVHVNYGATMTRTTIGHHTTIAPGVTICGDVTIGDRVFVGAGAVIKNLVTIGDDAFICMGSVVTRDVEPGEKYR